MQLKYLITLSQIRQLNAVNMLHRLIGAASAGVAGYSQVSLHTVP